MKPKRRRRRTVRTLAELHARCRSAPTVYLALLELAELRGSRTVTPTRAELGTLTGILREKTISAALTALEWAAWVFRSHKPVIEGGRQTATLLRIVILRRGRKTPHMACDASLRRGRNSPRTKRSAVEGEKRPKGRAAVEGENRPLTSLREGASAAASAGAAADACLGATTATRDDYDMPNSDEPTFSIAELVAQTLGDGRNRDGQKGGPA